VAAHEARQLELDLDAAKVALATLESEITTAQVVTTDTQAHIASKDFACLIILMDVHGL
jgi:hypothetical protein